MTTMDRIAAHKRAGTLYSWVMAPYSDREVVVLAVVDVSGKGRFQPTTASGITWEAAMRDLADQCDALPGAGRVKVRAA